MLNRKPKTVAGILAGFQKTVQALRDCSALNQEIAEELTDQIALAKIQRDEATAEASKASVIADQIERMINPTN